MQIMKLDSCGSALFLCTLQHICNTTVMADKKTEGQSVKKTGVVSFLLNMKSNISQLSHGSAQPREWLNFIQVQLRGAGFTTSVKQHITSINTFQSLGHLFFPGCFSALSHSPCTISFTPGKKKLTKPNHLSIMINAPVVSL